MARVAYSAFWAGLHVGAGRLLWPRGPDWPGGLFGTDPLEKPLAALQPQKGRLINAALLAAAMFLPLSGLVQASRGEPDLAFILLALLALAVLGTLLQRNLELYRSGFIRPRRHSWGDGAVAVIALLMAGLTVQALVQSFAPGL
ncbi:hypothetical protein ACFP81_11050 [Deinococcus lacus]|uniref:Uncharacterized protein n=1 Tax=Deinococcus lacus TaxID=392561 RepID=A0ABW1YGB1_9DEIO